MYVCKFPGCKYKTKYRSQIVEHHIIPKEFGGNDKSYNLICLCPTHHTKIFISSATAGIHTIRGDDSIILNSWFMSTKGIILEYIDNNGDIQYHGVDYDG